jgi:hypothetical protein
MASRSFQADWASCSASPLRLGREVLGDQQQPRDVLGAFEVAPHPVQRVGDAGEHQALREASTQVSLLPPPWEEFTT